MAILAGAERHLDGIAERVNFGRQSAAGSADGLRPVFFERRRCGERARWWRQYSLSQWLANSLKSRSKTPILAHQLKR
jgi:hypothetical protein